ncbi:uncharacterized protein LOC116163936 [Photinus pyralis]|uniref:uncharacterized protein LOC116163936 n=1 Tax=Photinus pyralis TaxID=7054 RepID=UPI00126746EF|nr:uncharacterized protein LOC116163936 [Photinus pyralis]
MYKLNDGTSIFTAELYAILQATKLILRRDHEEKWILITDSLSALTAIQHIYCTHPCVQEIHTTLTHLSRKNKKIVFAWTPSHRGITGNEEADQLAKHALTSAEATIENLSTKEDHQKYTKKTVRREWEREWSSCENLLRSIKDDTQKWKTKRSFTRKEEVIITRLRIGHTHLTHGYLMEKNPQPPPRCENCNRGLTVKHLLIECPEYTNQRTMSGLAQ